ncbi:TIR domain [Nesidiocoris tenuis]|uniref:TIR domain n=1 Tax=Nesidiocoris tenuis TaxID=355587 RepID=A0ABN7AIT9_9HEMI|nr:TIR domain [Nesidiocoris tenuis]
MAPRTAYLALVAIAVHVVYGQSHGCPEGLCQDGCNCTCVAGHQSSRDFDLYCPRGDPNSHPALFIGVQGSNGGAVEIKCITTDVSSIPVLLRGLNLGQRKSYSIKHCPLPTVPFHQLMQETGVVHPQALYVQSFANYSNQLTRRHFSGLGGITELTLTNNMLTDLPEDLFMDTGNLTWLNLRDNLLRLPKTIFRPVPKLDVLELGVNNLSYLEPGIFRNLTKLRLLNLWGNRLKNLTRSLFSDLNNLEALDLSSNQITTLPPDIFSDLPNLKKINLHGNNFIALPQGLFSSNPLLEKFQLNHNRVELRVIPAALLANLPKLQEVQMHHCNISSLPENLFWGSTSLSVVSLASNALTSLPPKLLKDCENLQDLDLSHNSILTVPDEFFYSQRKLTKLNLSFNLLVNITQSLFYSMESLTTLDMSHNNISVVARALFPSTLTSVDLSYNEISDLLYTEDFSPDSLGPASVFQGAIDLKTVRLSHNRLTRLYADWLNNMLKLETVDLSYNNLTFINDDVYFSSGPIVDLSYNQITVVDFNELETKAKLKFLGIPTTQLENESTRLVLTGNPLRCDCSAYGLLRLLRDEMQPETKYLLEVDATDLVCASPIILHNKLVQNVDPMMVNCPWRGVHNGTQCPSPCFCLFRPYTRALVVDCSSKNLTSWPTALPLPNKVEANHTELYFFNNSLSTVPVELHPSYLNVTHLYLSENRLERLNLSHFSPHIKVIELNDNNFTSLGSSLQAIEGLRELATITLMNNPWKCDCSAKELLYFIHKNIAKVRHYGNITCSDGQKFANLTLSDLCPISGTAIGIGSVIIALIGLLIGGLFALYYRYQKEIKVWLYAHRMCLWFVTEDELDKDKRYDAFISYSHQDESFVVNELVRVLENNSPKYKLCLHYRDWIVGDFIPNQIARSVEESKRTVIVLSPSFIESEWGRMEFRTAHKQALSEKRARVIIILYGDIGDTEKLDPELKAYLTMNTYVKWGDPWFWDKLLYALPHPPEITKTIPSLCRKRSRRHPANEKLVTAATVENGSATTPPAFNIIEPLKTLSNTKPV